MSYLHWFTLCVHSTVSTCSSCIFLFLFFFSRFSIITDICTGIYVRRNLTSLYFYVKSLSYTHAHTQICYEKEWWSHTNVSYCCQKRNWYTSHNERFDYTRLNYVHFSTSLALHRTLLHLPSLSLSHSHAIVLALSRLLSVSLTSLRLILYILFRLAVNLCDMCYCCCGVCALSLSHSPPVPVCELRLRLFCL